MPLGQLTLVKRNEGKPLRADQAGLPRTCLPPRTKQNEAMALRTAAGSKNQLTIPAPKATAACREALRRRKVDLLLHDRRALLRLDLPAAVQFNERSRLLAAMARRGCLILGAARRTSCRRRH